MKKTVIWIAIILISFFAVGVFLLHKDLVEQNIELAGSNGCELRKVLHHYQTTGEEQKERFARFIIANMLRKGCIFYVNDKGERKVQSDLEYITADFLIENIDLAVEVWKKYPWCSHLTEREFCRDLLPYRIKNEPLENWRAFYYHKYRKIVDSLAKKRASMKEVVFFFNQNYGKKYLHEAGKIRGDMSYLEIEKLGGGTCDHLALNAVQMLRSIGIPLNLDELPYHGKVNGGHAYNSFTDEQGTFIYFSPYDREPERKQWVAPIVNRISFTSPRYRKVTSYYYKTADIMLLETDLWIATFNGGKFKKIMDGKRVGDQNLFEEISCGLLYFPMKQEAQLVGMNPFIMDSCGNPQYIPYPEKDKKITINGIHLYDVKSKLLLNNKPYILKGWNQGWVDLKNGVARDSITLDFGEVSDYKLFLVYGNTYMGKMQRPFIFKNGVPIYY